MMHNLSMWVTLIAFIEACIREQSFVLYYYRQNKERSRKYPGADEAASGTFSSRETNMRQYSPKKDRLKDKNFTEFLMLIWQITCPYFLAGILCEQKCLPSIISRVSLVKVKQVPVC